MAEQQQQVVIVTGTSSGIGLAVSVLLAQNNYKVYATMRNTNKSGELVEAAKKAGVEANILVRELDVTSDESVKNAVDAIIKETGRIDILINNAGFSKYGNIEQLSIEDGKEQFETNVWGVVRCNKAVLPTMRQQKKGKILVTSSIGGLNGAPFNDIYCASKFAVEGMVESMAPVYKKLGIDVISIEPGATASEFLTNAQRTQANIDDFADLLEATNQGFAAAFKYAQTPEQVAQVFLKAIQDEQPQLRYQTSELLAQYIKTKGSDNTGNTGMNLAIQRYLNVQKQ